MPSSNKRTFFGEYVFEICDQVYEPCEDSFFFAENLNVQIGTRILDMGTGSGILGIIASKKASEVVLIDLNPFSIRCAKQNALINNAKANMTFIQGDLFSPIIESTKFDSILFNAPYLPTEQGEQVYWLSRAWSGGTTGRQIIDRFISTVSKQLKQSGEVLLLQSNLASVEETQARFLSEGLRTKIVASLRLPFFETLTLIKATF